MKILTNQEIQLYLQSGDPSQQELAFRNLYRQYFGMIDKLVLNNSGKREDAADIFHDGLLVLFKRIKEPDFKLTSSLKTYLYSICRNLWLMKLRKQGKETSIKEEHQYLQIADDQYKVLEQTEKKALLLHLLNELGDDCRRILELFYYRKLRMDIIREKMGLSSIQVAKNKKSRCLKYMREKVRKDITYQEALR